MSEYCHVTVYGVPAPQGSKNPYGGESNPRTKPWRSQVAQAVGEALEAAGLPPLHGPVRVEIDFVFPRPKKHYRANGELRADRPHWHTAPNDLDKLQRAIGDALTGVAYADDKQICAWTARKCYGERACAVITVYDLAEGSHDERGTDSTEQGPGSGRPDRGAGEALPVRVRPGDERSG